MKEQQVSVLDAVQIQRKIERIAHQIIEFNYNEKEVVLIGIASQGWMLAGRIGKVVEANSNIKVHLVKLVMDKKKPLNGHYRFEGKVLDWSKRSVIIADDVLNSGRTLIYAVGEVLKQPLAKLTTVALVDRRHRKFPIKADFVGLTLSTTMQDHITVDLTPGKEQAWIE